MEEKTRSTEFVLDALARSLSRTAGQWGLEREQHATVDYNGYGPTWKVSRLELHAKKNVDRAQEMRIGDRSGQAGRI